MSAQRALGCGRALCCGPVLAVLGVVLVTAALTVGCRGREPETAIVLPPTSVVAVQEQHGMVVADSLRVRAQPSVRSEVLSYLRRDEVVEVLQRGEREEQIEGEIGYWYEVTYQGVTGWVFGSHLELID